MTALSIAQDIVNSNGITPPITTLVGNSSDITVILLQKLNDALGTIANETEWPQTIRLASITLATGVDSYALPTDFDSFSSDTVWNQNDRWPMRGPISPEEWNQRKYGFSASQVRQKFRIKGATDKVLFITPTPDSGDNGHIVSFEYQCGVWARPKTWVTSTAFAAATYCWYNGNIYYTSAGGTTGATPPTHTAGSVSDGAVTWTYQLISYKGFVADTDLAIFDEDLVKAHAEWLFLRTKGLQYAEQKQEAYEALKERVAAVRGFAPFRIGSTPSVRFINQANIPDTGWGV